MSASSSVHQQQDAEDPPFFWWYEGTSKPTPLSLASCTTVDIEVGPNQNNTDGPQPEEPYTLMVYPTGFLPRRISASPSSSTSFSWTVDLPQGTNALLQVVDGNGLSGGTSPLTTIISGSDDACLSDLSYDTPLSFSFNPQSPSTCDEVEVTAYGGQPPYTLSVINGARPSNNFTDFEDHTISWVNSVPPGGTFLYALSDDAGNTAPIPDVVFSQGGKNKTCLPIPASSSLSSHEPSSSPTSGSSDTGSGSGSKAVVGGAVAASVLAVVVFAAIGYLFFRRRQKAKAAVPRQSLSPEMAAPPTDSGAFRPSIVPAPVRPVRPSWVTSQFKTPNYGFKVLNPDPLSESSSINSGESGQSPDLRPSSTAQEDEVYAGIASHHSRNGSLTSATTHKRQQSLGRDLRFDRSSSIEEQ